MKAVILAAGFGTRISTLFPDIPKAMVPIQGVPILEHHIKHLKKFGVKEFYINLHHLPNVIKDHFGNGENFGVQIEYSFERKLLGTSGALANFKNELNETFIVLYADIFTNLDFGKFLKFHKKNNSQATLLVHETDHPSDSDLVVLDTNSKIKKFHISPHTKPVTDTSLSNAAIYILEPEVLQFLPPISPTDFVKDFFPILLEKRVRMFGYLSSEFSKDIGVPERYRKVIDFYEKR